eukprot:TRINITY_DN1306_c0_g1_i1.p1 TRINITY_DN1306_c0_g1~~TRINITY_DN1306_c0_g1_i1.p1  ORF type:complete len:175 (-),score=27.74 TRINITY_DN1306_c0_g1_i1:304-828(-)
MRWLLVLLAASLTSAWPEWQRSHRLVNKHPPLSDPVYCVVQEAQKNATVAANIQKNRAALCACLRGTYDSNSFQCWNADYECKLLQTCYPAYQKANLDANFKGCVEAEIAQCDESVSDSCNEGKICKAGDNPGGLTAGGIIAIVCGIVYGFGLIIILVLRAAAKKRKAPAYEGQ